MSTRSASARSTLGRSGCAASLLVLSAALSPLPAQSWRSVTAATQAQPGDSLRVRISFAAGTLVVGAAPASELYQMRFRYDTEKHRPVRRFDPVSRTLSLDMDSSSQTTRFGIPALSRSGGGNTKDPNQLTLALGRDVPLDIALELGGVEARIDLTGLSVDRLRLDSKGSETRVVFAAPNPRRMRSLEIAGGATGIAVEGLGNANAEHIEVRTSLGGVDLDFGGTWATDVELRLEVSLGGATLRVPRNVGVRVRSKKFLAAIDLPGLQLRDEYYYSANWASAPHKLTVDSGTTMGALELAWIDH